MTKIYGATIAPPAPIPWGWMATPQATLERIMAPFGPIEPVRSGGIGAAAVRCLGRSMMVEWGHGGHFSVASLTGDPVPVELIGAIQEFVAARFLFGRGARYISGSKCLTLKVMTVASISSA